jgi:hypothetical protein
MVTFLNKQRPPLKKMGRRQRLSYRTDPGRGVPWANWLDNPVPPPVEPLPDPEPDPTSSWTKVEIIAWLVAKGVIVNEGAASHFTKAELLDIVEAYLNDDQDTVDELIGG